MPPKHNISIITAPSILGLSPSGVEHLAGRLLATGLDKQLHLQHPILHLPTLNAQYSSIRDPETNCLNPNAIAVFSQTLGEALSAEINNQHLPLILGGDCSILLGIMSGLKTLGAYGLVFLDAHADFYEPEKSPTGEVADMDLAIVTGRGPEKLTNIAGLKPYVLDEHVVQVGQRDAADAAQYGSQDIRETPIRVYDFAEIEKSGIETVTSAVINYVNDWDTNGFWLHFDTDVLSDEDNPAVEYRLPGGLRFSQVEHFIHQLLLTGKLTGISITVYNPLLDPDHHISHNITSTLVRALS